jgi:DNA-binding IscR family transcriptional regulator
VISKNPGITIPDIAKQLGIRQNYLYRVMAKLQQDKRVRRRNRGYYPAGG